MQGRARVEAMAVVGAMAGMRVMVATMEENERDTTPAERDVPRWRVVGRPYLLTRDELLSELHDRGFKVSESQLRSWVTQGILPRPERRVPPYASERKARALYPLWIIGMIFGILEKMQFGYSLEDLKKNAPNLIAYWQKREDVLLSRSATQNIVSLPVSPGIMRAVERAVWEYIDRLTASSGRRVRHVSLDLHFEDEATHTLALRPYPPPYDE